MHAVYTLCLYKLTSYYMGNCTFVKKRVGIKMQEISNSKFHCVAETIYAIWQYGLWSFQTGDTKLEKKLPKN